MRQVPMPRFGRWRVAVIFVSEQVLRLMNVCSKGISDYRSSHSSIFHSGFCLTRSVVMVCVCLAVFPFMF